jgi:hypothetical protein
MRTLLLVLQLMAGPGDGRVPIVLEWDAAHVPGTVYTVEVATPNTYASCFHAEPQKRVITDRVHCTVWLPPSQSNVLRVRAERDQLRVGGIGGQIVCPAGYTPLRSSCITPWSDPIWVGQGAPPGPYRVTFVKELG